MQRDAGSKHGYEEQIKKKLRGAFKKIKGLEIKIEKEAQRIAEFLVTKSNRTPNQRRNCRPKLTLVGCAVWPFFPLWDSGSSSVLGHR